MNTLGAMRRAPGLPPAHLPHGEPQHGLHVDPSEQGVVVGIDADLAHRVRQPQLLQIAGVEPSPDRFAADLRLDRCTIVAERDLVLTLEGPDRERFAFDVSQAEWVEPSV